MQCNPMTPVGVGLVLEEVRGHERYWKQNLPDANPIRCLVVDDDHTILKYVARMLAMLELVEVETAQSLPELTNKLVAGPYELLITDLEMPDMNGYDLAQKMKKRP